jgi:hypothetical protein
VAGNGEERDGRRQDGGGPMSGRIGGQRVTTGARRRYERCVGRRSGWCGGG